MDTDRILARIDRLEASLIARIDAVTKAQPAQAKPAPRFYTVREVCALLRIGRTKLYDMVKRRQLRRIKRGSKVLFLAVEVDGLIAKEERAAR